MGLRRHRAVAVGCLLLVLLVASERRLAEVHLNRLSASPVFENDDLLDGDEIRVRLSAVVPDVQEPDLSGILRIVWRPAPIAAREAIPPPPLRWSSSRSPPALSV
ncbi:MAG TPA: hypothetical protein VGL14_01395 [Methylomirabilota bacterium]